VAGLVGVGVTVLVGVGVGVTVLVGVGVGLAVDVGVGVGVGSTKTAGAAVPTANLLAKKLSTETAGNPPARRLSYLATLAI
jgi:hypothetical protein